MKPKMASFLLVVSNVTPILVVSLIVMISMSSTTHLVEAYANKTQLIQEFLDGHNAARSDVGVAPLKWQPLLSKFARIYSNERRADCKLVHSPGSGFGETLFWGQGKHWSAKDAVAAWVAEKKWYHHYNNSCTAGPGLVCWHYTQVVWNTTTHVGCSKIICDSGDAYMACEYHPPGNYIGLRPY